MIVALGINRERRFNSRFCLGKEVPIACLLREHYECVAEVVLGPGPSERYALTGGLLQGSLKGGDGLLESCRGRIRGAECARCGSRSTNPSRVLSVE